MIKSRKPKFDVRGLEETRTLHKENIREVISLYLNSVSQINSYVSGENPIDLLRTIKRHELKQGPYPSVSLFEAANRIMTDLTILRGVHDLLHGAISNIDFKEYTVEFGNESNNDHDITAKGSNGRLIGEAFNVAPSFFQGKKASALSKLRGKKKDGDILLLVYNSDAPPQGYEPKEVEDEFHLPVKLDFKL